MKSPKVQRNYIVEQPIRGIQYYMVKATSKADALRWVNDPELKDECEAVDFCVSRKGKATKATLDI